MNVLYGSVLLATKRSYKDFNSRCNMCFGVVPVRSDTAPMFSLHVVLRASYIHKVQKPDLDRVLRWLGEYLNPFFWSLNSKTELIKYFGTNTTSKVLTYFVL